MCEFLLMLLNNMSVVLFILWNVVVTSPMWERGDHIHVALHPNMEWDGSVPVLLLNQTKTGTAPFSLPNAERSHSVLKSGTDPFHSISFHQPNGPLEKNWTQSNLWTRALKFNWIFMILFEFKKFLCEWSKFGNNLTPFELELHLVFYHYFSKIFNVFWSIQIQSANLGANKG